MSVKCGSSCAVAVLPRCTVERGPGSLQAVARILMRPPFLSRIGNKTNSAGLYAPASFHIEGFSARSYTGATIVLALRVLFPCPVTAVLGAIAMPKGVMGALLETASPGQYDIHLIHAEDDALCNWHPSPSDRHTFRTG